MSEAAEKEWLVFREERTVGVAEILKLRERVAEEDARKKSEQQQQQKDSGAGENEEDVKMGDGDAVNGKKDDEQKDENNGPKEEAGMDVDDTSAKSEEKPMKAETKVAPVVKPVKREPMADEDDAVEY